MYLLNNFAEFSYFCCRKTHCFKAPLDQTDMLSLKHKMFSAETMKKVHWAKRMFDDWKLFRNSQEHLISFHVDLDDISKLSKEDLVQPLCQFLTEVKKLDGSDYPGKTLYEILISLQFWLETKGISWKLIND